MEKNSLKMATVITTDKCSAACRECCFQCNPKNNKFLSLETIKSFIKTVKTEFDTVETIVFTGGEALLLKNVLFDSIQYATSLGLSTRVVSNGFWAKSEASAKKIAKKLKTSGLTEINFSTGDNHQEWVSVDCIANACTATINEKIRTVVSIESFDEAKFTINDFYIHPKISQLYQRDDIGSYFDIINSVWIPMNNDVNFHYDKFYDSSEMAVGCDSILEYIGINPSGEVISCCGLTLNRIKEMQLGEFNPSTLKTVFEDQFNDLLKIWIWTDGPEYIYTELSKFDNRIYIPKTSVHMCQYCAFIFNNPIVKEILGDYLTNERITSILDRYHLKLKNTTNRKKEEVAYGK